MMKKILTFLWQNISEKQKIFKNSFWIAFSRFGGSILRALLIIYAFRTLGPSLQGSFSLAMNFVLIFSFIPDFGLTAILIREIIQNKEKKKEILANALLTVNFFLALALSFIFLTQNIFIKDLLAQKIILILAFFLIFDTLREFLYSLFRAEERMELQGITHLITNFLLLVLGISFLKIEPSPFSLAYAYLISGSVGFLVTFFLLRKEIVFNIFKFLNLKEIFSLLSKSWPIGIANFLFLVLTYIDSLIVGLFHSAKEVGLYSSVIKFSEVLYFFPAAIAMAVFPLVNQKLKNQEDVNQLLNFSFKLSLLISLPMLIGIFVLAREIISFVFGENYSLAYPALKLVSFSIPLNFLLLILIDTLIALDKRKELLIYEFLVVFINIILNIIFIPQFSYFASAGIVSFSSLISFIFSYYVLRKYIDFSFSIKDSINYFVSSILMFFLLLILNIHLIFKILLGAIFYFLILYLLRDELVFYAFQRLLKKTKS